MMSATTERVGIVLGADGTLRFQDLSNALLPLAHDFGWQAEPTVAQQDRTPAWWEARQRSTPFSRSALPLTPIDRLWRAHETEAGSCTGTASRLDLKRELARRVMAQCRLCEWHCRADRWADQPGRCGSGAHSRVSRAFLNWGEEWRISPGYAVHFSGCNWTCPYCQYPDDLRAESGDPFDPVGLARAVAAAASRGARTIHFLGGNPDQHLLAALDLLLACESHLEVAWNANGYASVETMVLLDGVVDVWLLDLRYGKDDCAERLGGGPRTWETVTRNLRLAAQGGADVIVRHLQLPGHWSCCTEPCLRWLAAGLDYPNVWVNLLGGQYWPAYRAHAVPGLDGYLPRQEYERACTLARRLGLRLVDHERVEVNDV